MYTYLNIFLLCTQVIKGLRQLLRPLRYEVILCTYQITDPYVSLQPIYDEADFSPSHKDESSVVETALSTMDNAHVYATPYEKPVNTKPSLVNGLYEVSTISPFEMAESIKVEEQIYHTLCEDEENIGPAYSAPASNEQAIYEEYEGKRFHKLHHKDIV